MGHVVGYPLAPKLAIGKHLCSRWTLECDVGILQVSLRKKAIGVPEKRGETQAPAAQTVRTDKVRRLLHSVGGTG